MSATPSPSTSPIDMQAPDALNDSKDDANTVPLVPPSTNHTVDAPPATMSSIPSPVTSPATTVEPKVPYESTSP